MSLLSELKTVADACSIPVETGVFSGVPPDLYLVITPMADTFELHADNFPGYDTQEAVSYTHLNADGKSATRFDILYGFVTLSQV